MASSILTPTQVVAQARVLLGVKFRHQGRDAQHGIDCLGLLLVIAEQLQLRFGEHAPMQLDSRNYRTQPDTDFLQMQLAQWLIPIDLGEAKMGDIILLRIAQSPQHLAILSDYPATQEWGMIHAHAVARKVVEHRYDAQWKACTHAAYRLPQLAN